MTNRILIYLLVMLFLPISGWSQSGPGVGYYGAMRTYFANKDMTVAQAYEQGEQARNEGDLQRAEFWYAYALSIAPPEERDFETYVSLLNELGKCSEAKHMALQFLKDSSAVCQISASDLPEVSLKKLDKINSKYLEFGVLPIGEDEILFTSNRKPREKSPRDGKTGDFFAKIFKAKLDENFNVTSFQPFLGDFENDNHTGYPAMFSHQKSMIFSQNNKNFLNPEKDHPLHLYYATFDGKRWSNFEPLSINEDVYNSCHSALNEDNDVMIFSSDRPGGFGKMDLYVSYRISEKEWSDPVNLGPNINTAENELFPMVKSDVLFFSSDGHGDNKDNKLDIVQAFWPNKEIPFFWMNTQVLPQPLNSKEDDISFSMYPDYKKGFLSSDRGRSDDDIYMWKSEEPLINLQKIKAIFKILDPALLANLDNRSVNLKLYGVRDTTITAYVNEKGEVEIPFDPLKYSAVKVEKEDFVSIELPLLDTKMAELSDEIRNKRLVPVETPSYTFASRVEAHPSTLSAITIEVTDLEDFAIKKVPMGKDGSVNLDDFKLEKSYEIKVFKNGRLVALEAMNPTRNKNLKRNNERVLLDLLYKDETEVVASTPTTIIKTEDKRNELSLAPLLVYYNTNEYTLDDVDVRLLNDFISKYRSQLSEYEVIVEGHTDIIGSLTYNKALSKRRADKVAAYLRSKGINDLRVSEYGETRTIQEKEHRLNRRVEIRLAKKR